MKKNYSIFNNKLTNKQFVLFLALIFFVFSFYTFLFKNNPNYFILFVSIIFYLLSIYHVKLFTYPNYYWHKLGMVLSKITNPIILGIIYIFTIIPIAVIFKIFYLYQSMKKSHNQPETYWINRNNDVQSMKNQF